MSKVYDRAAAALEGGLKVKKLAPGVTRDEVGERTEAAMLE